MSHADWVWGAKIKEILKFKTGVLEKNNTNRKEDLKVEVYYLRMKKKAFNYSFPFQGQILIQKPFKIPPRVTSLNESYSYHP